MKVRPLQDWIVVLLEENQAPSSIIAAPDTHQEPIRKGKVLEVGPGMETNKGVKIPVGVVPGDKVCFLRWHNEHRPGKAQVEALMDLSNQLGGSVVMIRSNDILFAYEGDGPVELKQVG